MISANISRKQTPKDKVKQVKNKASNKSIKTLNQIIQRNALKKLLRLYNATTRCRQQYQQYGTFIANPQRMKRIFEIPEFREVKTKNSHGISLPHARSISSVFLEIPTKNCSFSFPSPRSQNCLFFFPPSLYALFLTAIPPPPHDLIARRSLGRCDDICPLFQNKSATSS